VTGRVILSLPVIASLAVAGLASRTADALVLKATGAYTLGGASFTDVADGPNATSVDIIPYITDSSGDSVFFHVYGNSSNVFGSRSSGEGDFTATGTFSLSDTITNTSGVAGNFFLDYVVTAGELRVNCGTAANCAGTAGYDINIAVDGSTVEAATGDLLMDNSGTTLSTTGFGLSGATQSGIGGGSKNGNYSWSNTHRVANLGFFNPGETFSLDYTLITTATGAFGNDGSTNCYGGDGGIGGPEGLIETTVVVGGGTSACPGGSAGARSGDPNNVTGPTVFNVTNSPVGGIPSGPAGGGVFVPEPGTLGLLGLGLLAGLGIRRRRSVKPRILG